ncbi:MAG: oligopeptidase B, partial [Acidimicrobiales bacterium]
MSTPTPPVAPRRPYELKQHGDVRVDDWYWLGDKDDDAVIEYLSAENAYAAEVMAPTEALQERLFQSIKARVVENDCDAPVRSGPYWY